MKKIFGISLLTCSFLIGDTFVNPLPASVKAIDNGGVKQSIDAYKDGIGAELMDKPGVATDNTAMNTLVFKYGEAAKTANKSIVNQVNNTAGVSTTDLALAVQISANNPNVDGTACNDNNVNTVNDKYMNNVCSGVLAFDSCEGGVFVGLQNAMNYCQSKGMRVPKLNEFKAFTPTANIMVCPYKNIYGGNYTWTSTTQNNGNEAFVVQSDNISYTPATASVHAAFVRCVF
jgi:hypothetical protein